MASEEKFTFESMQDQETIRSFLVSLIDGIEKKRIVLSTNGNEIELLPASLLYLQVSAKKKKDESKLSVKIQWKNSKEVECSSDKFIQIKS